MQPRSWINEIGMINFGVINLNEKFEKISFVPNLKTSLFPHQQTIVKAMCDIERTRTFRIDNLTTHTNACILSEPVGSGKTIDLLSVILLQKIPAIKPDIHYNIYDVNTSFAIRTKYSRILKPTIIFVGANVINQWIDSIKVFTNLKVFVIKNVIHLQELLDRMSDRSINLYDIVLVKNGKITRSIKFPHDVVIEGKNLNRSTYHIINIIENMREYCWARVILDDYDVCNIPSSYCSVNGLFTWYVSSTHRHRNYIRSPNNITTTAESLMIKQKTILDYHSPFNIQNTKKFIRETNNLPSIVFYKYEFENPNDQYVGLIQLFGDDSSLEISEMLNNDAINTASERLGIKTNDVSSIFQHMLGSQYNNYITSTDLIQFIEYERTCENQRLSMTLNENKEDTYNQSHIKAKRHIEYKYPGVNQLLTNSYINYKLMKETSGAAIERVKSNIKDGECPICVTDLDDCDEDVFILKCCGVAICGSCCVGAVIAQRIRICVKCRRSVNLRRDLIYLSQDFDLSKIIDDDMDYKQEDSKDEEPETQSRTKISALLDILNNIKPAEQQQIDINVGNLMKGTHVLPPAKITKVLIFANYDESLDNITKVLKEKKIIIWRLMGTPNNIRDMVHAYKTSTQTCALVINSIKYCAGLNLQCSSDLVFMHKINSHDIETQVIGRGQRLGRESPLKVHYMLYNNEYMQMNRENNVRSI